MQHVNVWGKDLGDESRRFSEAARHREKNAKNDLQSDIEGLSREYRECVKSGSGRFKGTFVAEEIDVVQTCFKKRCGSGVF